MQIYYVTLALLANNGDGDAHAHAIIAGKEKAFACAKRWATETEDAGNTPHVCVYEHSDQIDLSLDYDAAMESLWNNGKNVLEIGRP